MRRKSNSGQQGILDHRTGRADALGKKPPKEGKRDSLSYKAGYDETRKRFLTHHPKDC